MFSRALDIYYKRPLLYDITFTALLIILLRYLDIEHGLNFKLDTKAQNLGSIGLTTSGFILTLLTILLTVKSNTIIRGDKVDENPNAFQVFLASKLYSKSIKILKNGVLILLFISFATLAISTLAKEIYTAYGFYINAVCLIFILLTFLRCFHVINLILNMQGNQIE